MQLIRANDSCFASHGVSQPQNNPALLELYEYKRKIAALEEVLTERGIDAKEVMREAGLNKSIIDSPSTGGKVKECASGTRGNNSNVAPFSSSSASDIGRGEPEQPEDGQEGVAD